MRRSLGKTCCRWVSSNASALLGCCSTSRHTPSWCVFDGVIAWRARLQVRRCCRSHGETLCCAGRKHQRTRRAHGGDLHDAVCRGGHHVCLRGPPTHPASVPQPSHPPARRWDDLHGLAGRASAHEVCVRLLSFCVLALSASRGDHKILFTPLFAWLCAHAPLLHREDGTLPCDATTVRALRTTSSSQGLAHAPPRSQWLAASP